MSSAAWMASARADGDRPSAAVMTGDPERSAAGARSARAITWKKARPSVAEAESLPGGLLRRVRSRRRFSGACRRVGRGRAQGRGARSQAENLARRAAQPLVRERVDDPDAEDGALVLHVFGQQR